MLYDSAKFLLIAGPCALESEEVTFAAADTLRAVADKLPGLTPIFKGSFDKANRSSIDSPRGPGLERGLELLATARARTGLPCTTDIHLPEHAAPAAEVCDVLQIPAFLCRQTDLLVAAAQTGKCINVKKGQFLSPQEMQYIVDKLEASNACEIWLTERGTTFGYQNLVVDMRNFPLMAEYGHPLIFDGTHSVQQPGAGQGKTIGQRQFVPALARAATAAGASGLFVEIHPNPDHAISDAANQLPLNKLELLVKDCLAIRESLKHT